jgi:hypothetical protein
LANARTFLILANPSRMVFSRVIHVILQNIWVYDSLRRLKFGPPTQSCIGRAF